jgi:hypothetical protein
LKIMSQCLPAINHLLPKAYRIHPEWWKPPILQILNHHKGRE